MLEGSIRIDSVPEEGSEFIIEIPLDINKKYHENTVFEIQKEEDSNTFDFSETKEQKTRILKEDEKLRVLVVEDNPDNMLAVKALLKDEFSILEAKTGEEAVELANNGPLDLILMDINLPGISGVETFHRIRSNQALMHIPVIALSASVMPNEYESILSQGFDAFVSKPINSEKFKLTLREVLFNE